MRVSILLQSSPTQNELGLADVRILPSVSYKKHRLAESKRPSYQHSQPPHAVSPHHMAKLLWNSSDAVDEGTCQGEHPGNMRLFPSNKINGSILILDYFK